MNWTQFLEVVVPNEEARKELQSFAGKLALGERPDKGLMLQGEPMTGKTIIAGVMARLAAMIAGGQTLDTSLIDVDRHAHRFMSEDVALLRITLLGDDPKGSAALKSIILGDPMQVRPLYAREHRQVIPRCAVLLIGQSIPKWLWEPSFRSRFTFVSVTKVPAFSAMNISVRDFQDAEIMEWAGGGPLVKSKSKAELEKIAAEIARFNAGEEGPYMVFASLPQGDGFRFMLAWGGDSRAALATLIAGLIERQYDREAAKEVVQSLARADGRAKAREDLVAGETRRAGHA